MKTNEIIKTIKDLLEKSRGSLIKNLIYGKYPDLAEFIKTKRRLWTRMLKNTDISIHGLNEYIA